MAFGFAVAQPLFDVLGRAADFFVARRSSTSDIVALAALLGVGIPVAAGGGVALLRRAHARAGAIAHGIAFGLLAGAFVLQAAKRTPGIREWPGAVLVVLALAAGVATLGAFHRWRGMRSFFRLAWPAPILFAALFLVASPVRAVAVPKDDGGAVTGGVRSDTPIVMLVLDELPLASLLDADGMIDERLYPNFARLARDGTWYRNATTVHDHTTEAVPAMLSGRYPREGADLPILSHHPHTLFTLLGRSHEVRAFETYTHLCPDDVCRSSRAGLGTRWRSLIADLRVVSLHALLPDDLTRGLPPVTETVGNFGEEAEPEEGAGRPRPGRFAETVRAREDVIERFITSLGPSERPILWYLHTLMPHRPFNYLPSGQRYPCDSLIGREGPGWGGDPWAVSHQYQRHLLQVGYTDRMLGRVFERLDRAGTYERSLIVVASDHGMVFRPNASHTRVLTEETLAEMAPVPLLIKQPEQRTGAVDDRPVEVIDVLPTIVDALGGTVPWEVDGRSLLKDAPARRRNRVYSSKLDRWIEFDARRSGVMRIVDRKARQIGRDPYRFAPESARGLIGVRAPASAARHPSSRASLDRAASFRSVDPDGAVVPACISGRISGARDGTMVAVGVGDRVAAVGRTFEGGRFAVLVRPDRFRRGANRITIYRVDASAARARLTLIPMR